MQTNNHFFIEIQQAIENKNFNCDQPVSIQSLQSISFNFRLFQRNRLR